MHGWEEQTKKKPYRNESSWLSSGIINYIHNNKVSHTSIARIAHIPILLVFAFAHYRIHCARVPCNSSAFVHSHMASMADRFPGIVDEMVSTMWMMRMNMKIKKIWLWKSCKELIREPLCAVVVAIFVMLTRWVWAAHFAIATHHSSTSVCGLSVQQTNELSAFGVRLGAAAIATRHVAEYACVLRSCRRRRSNIVIIKCSVH